MVSIMCYSIYGEVEKKTTVKVVSSRRRVYTILLSWIIILCILYTLMLCEPNDLRPRYLIGFSYAAKTRYRNSSADIMRCHTISIYIYIYMRQVYRILSSNFRRTQIGSFRGYHDNSIGIYSSPSRIRHFCSHSVDRNKVMPIIANHSNPEKDGAR